MDTLDIHCSLYKNKLYQGTYACDMIPGKLTPPFIIIINTKASDHNGEHWVALYVKYNNRGIYFDSYGLPPQQKDIMVAITHYCFNGCKYNNALTILLRKIQIFKSI
ncbi:uncharacterized protein B4U80_05847 [Leptotrombidium deliense]|uniref:Ubiquitin-like protease family profile domain-containing protein n=1 Tax=Leptotrombidium deliense TaxID=299467 RepID=A0A443SDZ7_9ACAR|nr:uncharacterized protein B4U80_05847 [Leptotrombidium deliense]